MKSEGTQEQNNKDQLNLTPEDRDAIEALAKAAGLGDFSRLEELGINLNKRGLTKEEAFFDEQSRKARASGKINVFEYSAGEDLRSKSLKEIVRIFLREHDSMKRILERQIRKHPNDPYLREEFRKLYGVIEEGKDLSENYEGESLRGLIYFLERAFPNNEDAEEVVALYKRLIAMGYSYEGDVLRTIREGRFDDDLLKEMLIAGGTSGAGVPHSFKREIVARERKKLEK